MASSTVKEPEGLLVSSVQVRGALLEIKNNSGHVWAVPANEEEDSYNPHNSPFKVQHYPGYNPDFEYEFHGSAGIGGDGDYDDLPEMLNKDWVPVSRKELGVPEVIAGGQYGLQQDDHLRVGKQVCVMKPKILVERERKAFKRYVDTITAQIAPDKDSAKARLERQSKDAIVTDEIRSATTFKEPV